MVQTSKVWPTVNEILGVLSGIVPAVHKLSLAVLKKRKTSYKECCDEHWCIASVSHEVL